MPDLLSTWATLKAQADAADIDVLERLARIYASGYERIDPQVQALTQQIEAMQKAGKVTKAQIQKSAAYKNLMQAVTNELDDYTAYVRTELRTAVQESAKSGLSAGNLLMLASLADALGINPESIPEDTVKLPDALSFLADYLNPDGVLFGKLGKMSGYHADEVAATILDLVSQGKNPKLIGRFIQDAYGTGLADSLRMMRTAQLYSYRQANNAVQVANADVLDGVVWCAELDADTCASCISLHGQVFPVGTLCDDHHNGRCLVPGTMVSGLPATAFVSRHYNGEVVTIRTASGKLLTVTPNHPILTEKGWIAANLLNRGVNVVSYSGADWTTLGMNPDKYQIPTAVEKIPRTLGMNKFISVPTASEDFHGDGIGSNIHVIRTNSLLLNTLDTQFSKPAIKQFFCRRNIDFSFLSGFGYLRAMFGGMLHTDGRFLCDSNSSKLFFSWGMFDHQPIGFCPSSWNYSSISESGVNHLSGNTIRFCNSVYTFARNKFINNILRRNRKFTTPSLPGLLSDNGVMGLFVSEQPISLEEIRKSLAGSMPASCACLDAITGNIVFDSVVEVNRGTFSGQVYNLQTDAGWYIADNIITHNCAMLPLAKGMQNPIQQTGEDWFKSQPESVQRDAMGAGKFEAWQDGKFEFSALSSTYQDDIYGEMRREATLQELIGE